MVKVQIGTTMFFCDTPEEAVRVHRMAGTQSPIEPAANGASASQHFVPKTALKSRWITVIKKLAPYINQELSSDALADVVGASGSAGLGPKMKWLAKNLEADGLELSDFVIRKKPDVGPITWSVVKAA